MADMEREAARIGLDWEAAQPRMREIGKKSEVLLEDGETIEVTFTIDVTGLLETLRRVPDGAGTEAFLKAFEADQRER